MYNIIYLITCTKCKKHYVGETKRTLLIRTKEYLADIRHNRDTPVAKHFNTEGHSHDPIKTYWTQCMITPNSLPSPQSTYESFELIVPGREGSNSIYGNLGGSVVFPLFSMPKPALIIWVDFQYITAPYVHALFPLTENCTIFNSFTSQ